MISVFPISEEIVVKLHKEIVMSCPKCRGLGVSVSRHEGGMKMNSCACTAECAWQLRLVGAGLPLRLRKWQLSQLTHEFLEENEVPVTAVRDFISSLSEQIASGEGLFLHSGHGLAKSSIAGTILKEGLSLGIPGCYMTASGLLDLAFQKISSEDASQQFALLMSGQIKLIVIDEIDKVYTKHEDTYGHNAFSSLFAAFYNNLTSLIVCSNQSILEIESRRILDPSVIDRLRALQPLQFMGQSHRRPDTSIRGAL